MKKIIIAVIISVGLAFVADRYLFVQSALTLIPWSGTGIVLGIFCHTKKESLRLGSLYGFVLSFSFLVFGYEGDAPIVGRLPFFALLALVGAVGGGVLALIGMLLRRAYDNHRATPMDGTSKPSQV